MRLRQVFKKIIRGQQGFTLTEAILALVLFGIIATYVSFAIVPTLNVFKQSAQTAELTTLTDTVYGEISNSLMLVQGDATISADGGEITIPVPNNSIAYSVDDKNHLLCAYGSEPAKPVWPSKFYGQLGVQITYAVESSGAGGDPTLLYPNPLYTVTITIVDASGDALLTRENLVRPPLPNQMITEETP